MDQEKNIKNVVELYKKKIKDIKAINANETIDITFLDLIIWSKLFLL